MKLIGHFLINLEVQIRFSIFISSGIYLETCGRLDTIQETIRAHVEGN